MWIWLLCAVAVIASATVFGVVAWRSWRQVQGLRVMLIGVRDELQAYADRIQVAVPGEHHN
jgi:hypothetical protein